MREPLPEEFSRKTRKSTCTVWVGSCNSLGYGLITLDGKPQLAHRIAYESAYGPIPDGLVIDHLCRVRNCVNPAHLEAVTQKENGRRGRFDRSLQEGDTCLNGHLIETGGLYVRPSGKTECRKCRATAAHRESRRRPTTQKRSYKFDINGVRKRAS